MRRVNVRVSLKQRMNDILGTDSGMEMAVPGITPWSIQAAVLSNLRRVVSGIAANGSSGRVMRGMWITHGGGPIINISSGYGFTKNGDVIVLDAALAYTADVSTDDTWHLYAKHSMAVLDGDTYEDGKKTGFIGKEGTENIVYDDLGATQKDNVQSVVGQIIQQSSTTQDNGDWVLLGTFVTSGGTITEVTPPYQRGFEVDNTGWWRVPSVRTSGAGYIGTNFRVDGFIQCDVFKVNQGSAIEFQSAVQFDENVTFGSTKIVDLPGSGGDIKVGGVSGADFVGDLAGKTTTIVNGVITSVV